MTAVDNGVDRFFSPASDPDAARDPAPLVVAAGRLAPVKRFPLLLEAALLARARVPDLRLRIIGEGPQRGELERWIADHDAAGWVELPGWVSRPQLRDEYRRAWVVASASLAEGWGLTLTEGAACGVPAVASDIPGHRCSVVDGATGVLAPPARLGDALADVLSDHRRRDALGRRRPGPGPHAHLGRLGPRRAPGVPSRRHHLRSAPDGVPMSDARAWRTIVVVPTYDERENVGPLLTAVRAALPDADVLVVDDNSPDGTADAVEAAAAELGQVKLLRRPGKHGLGSAYRTGFAQALDEGYDAVVSMDVDLSHDPAVLPELLRLLDAGADAVIGSRYVPGGDTVDWPLHRRLLSRWGNRYTSLVLGLQVRDCTSGYRAYRADALRAIEPGTTAAEGYAFLTELVRRLVNQGFRVMETPIVFRDRRYGTSKMSGRIVVESMLLVTRWGARRSPRRADPPPPPPPPGLKARRRSPAAE